jgi:hypothetical protein
VAVDTGVRFLGRGRTVAFGVVSVGEFQDVPRTKRDTVAAALAAFFDNVDNTPGDLDFRSIQRNSPILHGLPSFEPVVNCSSSFPKRLPCCPVSAYSWVSSGELSLFRVTI